MKIAGVLFIVISAGSVGFRIAAGLKNRCKSLRQLYNAMQQLYHELAFCATPLPQVFALLAASCAEEHKKIFEQVSAEMEQNRWMTPRSAMERSLKLYPNEFVGEILLELAGKLGKYDVQAQLLGIEDAKHQMEEMLGNLEEERRLKSKTYKTLSICAGLAAAILLI